MSLPSLSRCDENLYEDTDLALIDNIHHGCRIGLVWMAASALLAGSVKVIEDPIYRTGAHFLILGGTLIGNYIVTTHTFSTQLK